MAAMLFWLPAKITAQELQGTTTDPAASFTFQAESSTFTYLTGGTVVSSIAVDEGVSAALPIGFTFNIGCSGFSTFYAGSNGTISFNNPSSPAGPSGSGPANTPLLAPLWADLSGTSTGTFSYKTTGTAPNRVLTAEWKNWKWGYTASTAVISFQVKIYEGTNTVEYIYNPEAGAIVGTYKAAIGIYNNMGNTTVQSWLSGSTSSPTASAVFSNTFITKPASGQLYRFNFINGNCGYYGQTIINPNGGMLADGSDGLRINLSGAGNMQIRRKFNATSKYQIYHPTADITAGTTAPYTVPGTTHGLVLSIGNTPFRTGILDPNAASNTAASPTLTVVSSTQQSLIENSPGHFVDVIKMSATKNGLVYGLELTYTYNYPASAFLIDYKVTIPAGNTEKVQLAHGWDTYLDGGDAGPGFKTGTATDLSDAVVGVVKSGGTSYEAFQYLGGVKWSGYFSAYYYDLNPNLGSSGGTNNPWMVFNNTIDPYDGTDNGIGISIDFGSTPGTSTSNNAIIFACGAGDIAPVLSGTTANPCAGTSFNLNSYVTSTPPAGTIIRWKDANGNVVADPANVNIAGAYTASYYSSVYSCASPGATITVTYNNACAICYKPAVTTGTPEPTKTIISTLDRVSVPRNTADYRAGSLILESTNKGFVLTRMASPETAITAPVEGMIVYDTVNKVIKLYNGTTWHTLTQQGCPD